MRAAAEKATGERLLAEAKLEEAETKLKLAGLGEKTAEDEIKRLLYGCVWHALRRIP